MFIKRLKPNTYDVFVGNGWNNWTRVQRRGGEIKIMEGAFLHRGILNQVRERLCK